MRLVRDLVVAAVWALGGSASNRDYIHGLLYAATSGRGDIDVDLGFVETVRGPRSRLVDDAIDQLVDEGILGFSGGRVYLRDVGVVPSALDRLGEGLVRAILGEGDVLGRLEHDEMVLYIHVLYGGYKRGKETERVLQRRRELAAGMQVRGVVSTGLAARLAGLSYRGFVAYLRKNGIKPFEAVL